ncbi:MAG: plastocyanin/azurin family copper-binding protein [Chloroflexi bacterium]|nr:plastocyanin/azurin family copper-binding protein [Chloroflexota bacterium]
MAEVSRRLRGRVELAGLGTLALLALAATACGSEPSTGVEPLDSGAPGAPAASTALPAQTPSAVPIPDPQGTPVIGNGTSAAVPEPALSIPPLQQATATPTAPPATSPQPSVVPVATGTPTPAPVAPPAGVPVPTGTPTPAPGPPPAIVPVPTSEPSTAPTATPESPESPTPPPPTATPTAIPTPPTANADIVGFAHPNVTVAAGTAITWTNQDNVPHTVTAGSPGSVTGAFDSGTFGLGGVYSLTFDTPGEFLYFCTIHPSMQAVVTVQ